MIALAKISANGQITVPAEVRGKLGVSSGQKVIFYTNDRGEIVMANPASEALIIAQKAFSGAAEQMNLKTEQDADNLILSLRKGKRNDEDPR